MIKNKYRNIFGIKIDEKDIKISSRSYDSIKKIVSDVYIDNTKFGYNKDTKHNDNGATEFCNEKIKNIII